jgi:hypothetical protein
VYVSPIWVNGLKMKTNFQKLDTMNGDWEQRIAKIEQTTTNTHNVVGQVSTDVNDLKNELTGLRLAIGGSDKIGLKGFAKRMEEVEEYVVKDKKQKNIVYGVFITLSFLFGGLLKFVWDKIFGQ